MKPEPSSTAENAPPGAEASALMDSGLCCPRCDYNLTGLPHDRCPECGTPFDRQRMIAWATRPNQPILYDHQPFVGALRVIPISLFRPRRIGRELAARCDPLEIGLYSLVAKLLAGVIILAAARQPFHPHWVAPALVICVVVVCLAKGVESLIGALLAQFVVPRGVPLRFHRYRFWRNLCRCFAFHLVISSALWIVIDILAFHGGPIPILIVIAASLLWWWYNLSRAICSRGVPSHGQVVVILLIPVVGIIAVAAGVLVCVVGVAYMVMHPW